MSKERKSQRPSRPDLTAIPSVTEMLKDPSVEALLTTHARLFVLSTIRDVLDQTRKKLQGGEEVDTSCSAIAQQVSEVIDLTKRPTLQRVINATGVVLHTGLGRGFMAGTAVDAIMEAARGYCNLELDLDAGTRGTRQIHVEKIICMLTGGEAALVVNNNAAAVLLSLHTMSAGKDAIVSRGELIEIGGSFRLPEIMEKSGCRLVEIGTTNRTTLQDYRSAAGEKTGLFLKVHASNYSIVGFAERVELPELVELGRELSVPVLYDLGSGSLVPMDSEPAASEALADGADVICFSADKLLGGPQAGIIVGKKRYVDLMKKDPFARVARVCKLTLAALQATLLEYLTATDPHQTIPTLRLISKPVSEIEKSAKNLARRLKRRCGDRLVVEVVDGESMIGGGSFPTRGLPTKLVAVHTGGSIEDLARQLRLGSQPIVARVSHDRLLLDVRTIDDADHEAIASSFAATVLP